MGALTPLDKAHVLAEALDVFHRPDVRLHERLRIVALALVVRPAGLDARDDADLRLAPAGGAVGLWEPVLGPRRRIRGVCCRSIGLVDALPHAKPVALDHHELGSVGRGFLRGIGSREGTELLARDLGADALGHALDGLERCPDAERLQRIDAVSELTSATDLGEGLAQPAALALGRKRELLLRGGKRLCGTCGTGTRGGSFSPAP